MDRGQAGVGQRSDVLGLERVDLDDRARARLQQLGEAAVPVDPRKRAVEAMHVVADPARHAQAAGDERVHDHRVADRDIGDAGADLMDPAGVLVAGRVGQHDLGLRGPLALLDVQVGPAESGRADLDDHVERPVDLGLVDAVQLERVVVGVQPCGLHLVLS